MTKYNEEILYTIFAKIIFDLSPAHILAKKYYFRPCSRNSVQGTLTVYVELGALLLKKQKKKRV